MTKRERRQSASSTHLSRPRVPQSKSHLQECPTENKPAEPQVAFSTHYSSDDDDDEATMVHGSASEIAESPQCQPNLPSLCHIKTDPSPPKSSPKGEGLHSPIPSFLKKSLSHTSLLPPEVSMTNALSKDLTKSSSSLEHIYTENVRSSPLSEPQIFPSSTSTSQFISLTPPSRTSRTPDPDMTELRRNRSLTALATNTQDHTIIPLTTALQGKLTRTQQKLLLQRASTQYPIHPFNLITTTTNVSSPLQNSSDVESTTMSDYFSPLPFDVKVAREFDRISRELVNVRRFGDPTTDAIARLRNRIKPATPSTITTNAQGGLNKRPSAFGLNVSWKRLSDNVDSTYSMRGNANDNEVLGGRDRKVQEIMRRLWFDEADVTDIAGLRGDDGDDDDDEEEGEEVIVRKPKVKVTAWSH